MIAETKKAIGKHWLLLLILFFVAGWFYWFQLRPSLTRKACFKKVNDRAKEESLTIKQGDKYYQKCLLENGMKSEEMFKLKD